MTARYRPDIDGLRALAVLSVLAYHGFPRWLPGGLVGVDIFFVISGFLITGIIAADLAKGRFTFRSFYARRIRRIFPALGLVLAATVGLGWLVLFPDEFVSLGRHVAAGAGFLSNVVLWQETGYFDTTAELKPLLHLWSLGVEEQFYIGWPIVLVVLWRWPRAMAVALAVLVVLSFALNIWFVRADPEATFYLPMTRLWELLLGAGLALADQRAPQGSTQAFLSASFGQAWRLPAAFAGLALIGVALALIDRHSAFPGWWATLPTLGTVLLVASGPDTWLHARLLQPKVVVGIGLISYPLYLWHWPILSFGRIVQGGPIATGPTLLALAAAFALATATYFLIERPIRLGPRRGPRLVVTLASAVAVIGMVGVLAMTHDVLPRSADGRLDDMWEAVRDWSHPDPLMRPAVIEGVDVQTVGPVSGTQVLFFGDSNIEQFGPRVASLVQSSPDRYLPASFAAVGGCPPIPGVGERQHPGCGAFVTGALRLAHSARVARVVVAACWYCYFLVEGGPESRYDYYFEADDVRTPLRRNLVGDDRALEALERMLTELARAKPTYLVLNVPAGPAVDPMRMIRRGIFARDFEVNRSGLTRAVFLDEYGPLRQRLIEVARRAGAHLIDPMETLCDDTHCASVDAGGRPLYKDGAHLRASFMREHGTFIDVTVRKD